MIRDSELLRPSLAGADAPMAIYSVATGLFTSFFGGPLAGALIAMLSAHRLRRLSRDWPLAAYAVALSVALHWTISRHLWAWRETIIGRDSEHLLIRLAGLLFFAVLYAIHAPYYRSLPLLGVRAPNGLWIGILAILLGWAADIGLDALLPS